MIAPVTTYQPVEKDDVAWLGTEPIPAAPYYDPAYFELEREAVFRRTWLQIGHQCEISEPGCFMVRSVEILNAEILITHGKDRTIRAFHNVCTHRGTQLVSERNGKRASFTCPYHAWTFASDGQLRSAPDFERFYLDKAQCNLREIAIDVCGKLLFVHFEKYPAQSLRDFLGPIADQFEAAPVAKATTFSEWAYDIDANWKVNYDNFQENYHLRFIHPRTGAAVLGAENPLGYPVKYEFFGPHRTQTLWKNPAAAAPPQIQRFAFGKAVEFAAADGLSTSKVDYKIFPNLFVIGQAAYFFSHCVMPISANRSRGVIRLYWVGEDGSASKRFVREYVMAMLRDVHIEDRSIIEAGQRGLSSGALQHINFQVNEVLCRHLFNNINQMVEAYQAERKAAEDGT
jgi:phenylpropionate dioxygenase-like ring-hydroxylating dioxygenase large terminal subunit